MAVPALFGQQRIGRAFDARVEGGNVGLPGSARPGAARFSRYA
jgi:hypothetical protein